MTPEAGRQNKRRACARSVIRLADRSWPLRLNAQLAAGIIGAVELSQRRK
jgi:hypothetical protein